MSTEGFLDLRGYLMGLGGVPIDEDIIPYSDISYPLSIPSFGGIRSITFATETVRAISESPFTLHRQVFRHQGERWRASVTLPPMPRSIGNEWEAFLLQLDHGYGTFLFGDYFNPIPRGVALGTPVVDGADQTGKKLNVKGFNANVPGQLLPGDWIQIGTRLYKNLRRVDSDAAGEATLDIFPRLRTSPEDEAPLILNDARGTFRLISSGGNFLQVDITKITKLFSFDVVEAI